jgi:hypothetical protein
MLQDRSKTYDLPYAAFVRISCVGEAAGWGILKIRGWGCTDSWILALPFVNVLHSCFQLIIKHEFKVIMKLDVPPTLSEMEGLFTCGHKSLLLIYKLPFKNLNPLVSLFLFAFFWSCIGFWICGYLFSHCRKLLFLGGAYHLNSWDDFKIEWMRRKECSMNDTSLSQVCCWCTQLTRFLKKKWF